METFRTIRFFFLSNPLRKDKLFYANPKTFHNEFQVFFLHLKSVEVEESFQRKLNLHFQPELRAYYLNFLQVYSAKNVKLLT